MTVALVFELSDHADDDVPTPARLRAWAARHAPDAALPADATLCILCARRPRWRRCLCGGCYAKLRDHDITLPPAARPGQRYVPIPRLLRAWVDAMPAATRALFRAALDEDA